MIFRALFWIGLVSLLTPHEPDLGLGRPGAGAPLPSPASRASASGLSRIGAACGFPACAGALAILDSVSRAPACRTLDEVRAEIAADIRARKT